MEIEKLHNTIALKQQNINDIEKILKRVKESETEDIRIKIETKHWYSYSEPHLGKEQHKLYANKDAIISVLESAIERERTYINKCIDIEIEQRTNVEVQDE